MKNITKKLILAITLCAGLASSATYGMNNNNPVDQLKNEAQKILRYTDQYTTEFHHESLESSIDIFLNNKQNEQIQDAYFTVVLQPLYAYFKQYISFISNDTKEQLETVFHLVLKAFNAFETNEYKANKYLFLPIQSPETTTVFLAQQNVLTFCVNILKNKLQNLYNEFKQMAGTVLTDLENFYSDRFNSGTLISTLESEGALSAFKQGRASELLILREQQQNFETILGKFLQASDNERHRHITIKKNEQSYATVQEITGFMYEFYLNIILEPQTVNESFAQSAHNYRPTSENYGNNNEEEEEEEGEEEENASLELAQRLQMEEYARVNPYQIPRGQVVQEDINLLNQLLSGSFQPPTFQQQNIEQQIAEAERRSFNLYYHGNENGDV